MAKEKKKAFHPLFILIPIISVGLILSIYFSHKLEKKQSEPNEFPPRSTPTIFVENTIPFDVEKVQVGDTIGDMTITSISGMKTEKATPDSAVVQFRGAVQLTGEVIYTKPGGAMAESICMTNLDNESLAKMPKMITDTRAIWFCFTDLEKAKTMLDVTRKETQPATVSIDNYKIVYYPSEVVNTADVLSVEKK